MFYQSRPVNALLIETGPFFPNRGQPKINQEVFFDMLIILYYINCNVAINDQIN